MLTGDVRSIDGDKFCENPRVLLKMESHFIVKPSLMCYDGNDDNQFAFLLR